MYNTIEFCGVTYQPIGDAELVNVGAPAVAMWELLAYIITDTPDDMGYYDLYSLQYQGKDADAVDWYSPDNVAPCNRGYDPATGRTV